MIPVLRYGKDDTDKVFRRTHLGDKERAAAVAQFVADVRTRGDEGLCV